MEKAKQPTSQYKVFCDTYDMECKVEIHTTDDGPKLKLTLESEDGSTKQSISLFAEDVSMMTGFIENTIPFLIERPD